jgi:hypothetical protein
LSCVKKGQFGKRRIKLLGVLMMGFSFFVLKIIVNAVCSVWRQTKSISSKLLSLTNRSGAIQHGGKTGAELKAEGK